MSTDDDRGNGFVDLTTSEMYGEQQDQNVEVQGAVRTIITELF